MPRAARPQRRLNHRESRDWAAWATGALWPVLVGRREWGMYERRKSADLDGRFGGLGRGRDSFKRRKKAQFARACPTWPDRNRSGGKSRVNTIGSHHCRGTRIFDWGDQCRWKSHRQRLEPIHRRTCQWPWTQGLPLQQNVSEGNIKKCDDLLHLATSLEISSTRTRGCLGGPAHLRYKKGNIGKYPRLNCESSDCAEERHESIKKSPNRARIGSRKVGKITTCRGSAVPADWGRKPARRRLERLARPWRPNGRKAHILGSIPGNDR
jgi:hypothetical protein